MSNKQVERLKAKLRPKKKRERPAKHLSSGLTLVNLACSNRTSHAFIGGHDYLFVGASKAGKTWLMRQMMAEVANNPEFADYRIIDDNPERGALMDVKKFFGSKLVSRTEKVNAAGKSESLEDFYDNVDEASKAGVPFFYGLDSEDALVPEDELKRFEANKSLRRKGSKASAPKVNEDGDVVAEEPKKKGSFGTERARVNSSSLRIAHNGLEPTDSFLIIVKQERQSIGYGSQFNPKTRSGGLALTFYATLELWFSIVGKIRRKVNGKDRTIGSLLKIEVKKNRVSGRDRSVVVPFFPDHGFDETGSLVMFLIDEGHWKATGKGNDFSRKKVVAPEFEWEGSVGKLIAKIESEGKERQLRLIVAEVWQDIEDQCRVNRKPRYA